MLLNYVVWETCFIEAYWFPAAFGIVFILEAVLYNLKLKLSNSADNLSPVELIDKQLSDTLVHQLIDAFL